MKRISFALLILSVGLFSSCWGTKKKQSDNTPKDSPVSVKTDQPVKEREELMSNQTTDKLLLDAPVRARYLLSSAKELAQNKLVKFDFNKDGKEEVILLSRDHPNGVRILAERNNFTQNLINDIPEGFFFDQYGELKSQYSIQVTIVDLDGDNRCEVIVSIGEVGNRVDAFFFYIEDSDLGNYHYIGAIQECKSLVINLDKVINAVDGSGKTTQYILRDRELAELIS